MTTIIEENRNLLRPALDVYCGFSESADEPTSITPIGSAAEYSGLANLDILPVSGPLMDLGGDGFINDGAAVPMRTDTDTKRYGYISEGVAISDGTFLSPFGVTITAAEEWTYVTLEVRYENGQTNTLQYEPIWNAGETTLYIDKWTPGERAYIVGVYLGKTWLWNNSNLIGVELDLRSVNTEIGGELEVSSIEIRAYETTDYTDLIGRIPLGTPIWYRSGYDDDLTEKRNFYLSEVMSWDDNVLTVRGQDASMLLENVDVPVDCDNYAAGWYIDWVIGKRIRKALETIDYEEVGTAPATGVKGLQVILYDGKAARSIISEYTGLFRKNSNLRVTYVDAGRPTLTFGDVGKTWTIYADEIADFNTIVEQNKNRLEMVMPEYYLQHNDSIEEVETTAGKTYFVELDPPVPYNNIWISPTPTSSQEINCSLFKFKAAATTTYTIRGYQTLADLIDAYNPYAVTEAEGGETYRFDFEMPLFVSDTDVSVTQVALADIIDRSNIVYEFTYRGNPHIQPRDVLNVEIARWYTDQVIIDGLYPELDLYPATDLYPNARYRNVRKMAKTWETMTVDSVTLSHSEGGGLTSKIKARKGTV